VILFLEPKNKAYISIGCGRSETIYIQSSQAALGVTTSLNDQVVCDFTWISRARFKQTFLTVNLTVRIFSAFCFRDLPSESFPDGAKGYK